MESQRSFYHTSLVCGELFGVVDRYRLFREKILPQQLALRPRLEAFYCESNGRPAIDPVLLCGVTLLQFMEKVSDRRAAEQVAYHLGWKYALDLELPYEGFHPTVLVYFRDRLEENQAERVIFDGIVDLLIELGLIKRAGKQRIDSTDILGYVKEMSRLECAAETLRLALEGLAGVVVSQRPEFWDRLWSLYVQSEVGWRLSKAERDSRYRQCGQDISELMEWIDGNDPKLGELEAVKTEAAENEKTGLAEALKRQQAQHEIKPQAMYADAGYVTESTLSQAEANAMELLGPTRPDPHKGPYNADGFVVDVANQRAVCPQGKTSTQCSHIQDSYMGTESYRLEWGSQCDSCPVQKQCTRAKNGRRILVVGLRHDLVEQRRKEMKQAEFSRSMYPRNGIEGTHSELVRGHGLRRTKYRGLNRVSLSHYFIGAACNVKRYLRRLAFQIELPTLTPA